MCFLGRAGILPLGLHAVSPDSVHALALLLTGCPIDEGEPTGHY